MKRLVPYDVTKAIDFGDRSQFSIRPMIGVPPPYVKPEANEYGNAVLPKYEPATPAQDRVTPIPGESPVIPMPGYEPQFYGDAIVFAVVFGAAGALLVLPRPNQTRISLLIVNSTVVGNIFYTFDRVADNVSCVPIVAGGNRLFDFSVPQGDLNIFSSGAGTVIIEYMNRDIRQESYR